MVNLTKKHMLVFGQEYSLKQITVPMNDYDPSEQDDITTIDADCWGLMMRDNETFIDAVKRAQNFLRVVIIPFYIEDGRLDEYEVEFYFQSIFEAG